MSRVATAHPAQTSTPQTSTPAMRIPHDKIAMRAYDKWCKRGQPQGTDRQDWLEAESELRTEMTRPATPTRR